MRTCKGCRHYTWTCEHPKNMVTATDSETGAVHTWPVIHSAWQVRRDDALCGPSGAWWEPRITLRQRIAMWAIKFMRRAHG